MTETRKRKIQNKNKTGGKNEKYKKRRTITKYKKGGKDYTPLRSEAIPYDGFTNEEQRESYKRMMDFYNIGNTTADKISSIYQQFEEYDPEIILKIQDIIDAGEDPKNEPDYQAYLEYDVLVKKLNRAILTNRFYLAKYEEARNKYNSKYNPETN